MLPEEKNSFAFLVGRIDESVATPSPFAPPPPHRLLLSLNMDTMPGNATAVL